MGLAHHIVCALFALFPLWNIDTHRTPFFVNQPKQPTTATAPRPMAPPRRPTLHPTPNPAPIV